MVSQFECSTSICHGVKSVLPLVSHFEYTLFCVALFLTVMRKHDAIHKAQVDNNAVTATDKVHRKFGKVWTCGFTDTAVCVRTDTHL